MFVLPKRKETVQTKKITLLAAGALLLLTACGQVESGPAKIVPPPTNMIQENVQQPQAAPAPAITVQEPDTVSVMEQEQSQEEKTPQPETAPRATQNLEPVEEPTEDIPSETVHAKTGYVEPEPTPEPEPAPEPAAPADQQAAIDAANAYAVTQYGVTTDSGLTLNNSAYRFPAAVPVNASQETLEAKARDMVDFTFRQLMMQAGRDTIADAGFHCNICIVEDGRSLLIYVLYDG